MHRKGRKKGKSRRHLQGYTGIEERNKRGDCNLTMRRRILDEIRKRQQHQGRGGIKTRPDSTRGSKKGTSKAKKWKDKT